MWENGQNIIIKGDTFIDFTSCASISELAEFNVFRKLEMNLSGCNVITVTKEWWDSYLQKVKYKVACLSALKGL